MKIALFELEDWEKKFFQDKMGSQHQLSFFDGTLKPEIIPQIADIESLVIFINSQMTAEVLAKLPSLKFITTMSMGFDHIDLEYCKSHSITVCNVPAYGESTVAEHTFALMLAVSRKIVDSYKRIHEWNFSPIGLTGFDLNGKTLGVLGVGNIGKNVVKIGKGFGMNVLGYMHHPDAKMAEEFCFECVDFDTLYAKSDIISIHVPYTKETHHLLNVEAFAKMKDGVIIINTARGAIIDTNALMQALDYGKVAGAGLDVLEEEPLLHEERELLSGKFNQTDMLSVLENHMLVTNPKVVMTPHNAFNSVEALHKIVETTVGNITMFASGTPQNLVGEK